MSFIYSDALQRVYASAPAGLSIAQCILLTHPNFSQDWYLTNVPEDFEADFLGNTVTWEAAPFVAIKPNRSTGETQTMNIQVDNISPEITRELDEATKGNIQPVVLTYTEYIIDSSGAPTGGAEINPPIELSVKVFNVSLETVSFTATHEDVVNRAFPYVIFDIQKFPGLSNGS